MISPTIHTADTSKRGAIMAWVRRTYPWICDDDVEDIVQNAYLRVGDGTMTKMIWACRSGAYNLRRYRLQFVSLNTPGPRAKNDWGAVDAAICMGDVSRIESGELTKEQLYRARRIAWRRLHGKDTRIEGPC